MSDTPTETTPPIVPDAPTMLAPSSPAPDAAPEPGEPEKDLSRDVGPHRSANAGDRMPTVGETVRYIPTTGDLGGDVGQPMMAKVTAVHDAFAVGVEYGPDGAGCQVQSALKSPERKKPGTPGSWDFAQ